MIKLPEGITVDEIPIEKRYKSVTAGLIRRIKLLYEAVYERFGAEGLNLIKEVSDGYGAEIAERAKSKVKMNDLKSVALYVIKVFNTLRGNGEVVEFSDKRIVIRVAECPYPWTTPEVCEAHTQMEKTLVESLGKNLRYRIGKSLPKGDAYCDHIIEVVDDDDN